MSVLTQAKLDEMFELIVDRAPFQDSSSGKYYVITSPRTRARMEQGWLRAPKRRARRKALTRR